MKLKNLYKFELGKTIYNRAVSLGKFDGENFSITYATLGGKVVIYCPNDKKGLKQQNQSKETILNINKEIVTLTYGAGQFGSNKNYGEALYILDQYQNLINQSFANYNITLAGLPNNNEMKFEADESSDNEQKYILTLTLATK